MTVYFTPVTIIALRSHTKQCRSVVHSVNTEPLTLVLHASGKRLYTEPPGRVSSYTYW